MSAAAPGARHLAFIRDQGVTRCDGRTWDEYPEAAS